MFKKDELKKEKKDTYITKVAEYFSSQSPLNFFNKLTLRFVKFMDI